MMRTMAAVNYALQRYERVICSRCPSGPEICDECFIDHSDFNEFRAEDMK